MCFESVLASTAVFTLCLNFTEHLTLFHPLSAHSKHIGKEETQWSVSTSHKTCCILFLCLGCKNSNEKNHALKSVFIHGYLCLICNVLYLSATVIDVVVEDVIPEGVHWGM